MFDNRFIERIERDFTEMPPNELMKQARLCGRHDALEIVREALLLAYEEDKESLVNYHDADETRELQVEARTIRRLCENLKTLK